MIGPLARACGFPPYLTGSVMYTETKGLFRDLPQVVGLDEDGIRFDRAPQSRKCSLRSA